MACTNNNQKRYTKSRIEPHTRVLNNLSTAAAAKEGDWIRVRVVAVRRSRRRHTTLRKHIGESPRVDFLRLRLHHLLLLHCISIETLLILHLEGFDQWCMINGMEIFIIRGGGERDGDWWEEKNKRDAKAKKFCIVAHERFVCEKIGVFLDKGEDCWVEDIGEKGKERQLTNCTRNSRYWN